MSVTQTVTVIGMTCDHCVASVTEEISAIGGVSAVAVELETGVVTITSDAAVAATDVEVAVTEAGYSQAE